MKVVFEWTISIVIALALALLIHYYVFTQTVVKQTSMIPTINDKERLIVSRVDRIVPRQYKRGEIITFEAPSPGQEVNVANPIGHYEEIQSTYQKFVYYTLEIGKISYIKRVIGLPGEKVQIKDGKVYIDTKLLDEPYLHGIATPTTNAVYTDITVPQGYLFVMGDNRSGSVDSRMIGCIPMNKIEGRVLIRIWPLNRFGTIK